MISGLDAAVADPSRIRTRAIDLYAYGSDASHYAYGPEVVVVASTAGEVAAVMAAASAAGRTVTFRSGGTSLSGQGVTDSILLDVRRHFRTIEILDDGARVKVGPGMTVRAVNTALARYGYRLGPDPASEAACTIGGVVSNNSSGMACGTHENSYRTVESMVIVLPSGTVVDTGAADADSRLRHDEPALFDGLLALRRRVLDNPTSRAIIDHQFSMKNTMGYGINSLVDFDSPTQILGHLMIGGEGTLGFVAEVTFRTVPLKQHISTALTVFADLDAATRALPELVSTGAATLELMDATSIRVGQALPDAPPAILGWEVSTEAALLVEYQSTTAQELADLTAVGNRALAGLPLKAASTLSTDAVARTKAWKLRKGLYTSVAGARPSGTTALLEDVVVPVPALAGTCEDLTVLFDTYRYRDSVIFGHAKDGNIHFMLTDRFETDEQRSRLAGFTDDMAELVLGNGGSLKAEHGTGRAMAPYVRRQYGDELYDVMRRIKALADPKGVLNPGVLLDDDPDAHMRSIKLPITVEPEVDRCVECGYCEPVCPSKDLTLTPRQRIVLRRAHTTAVAAGDQDTADAIAQDYEYAGVQTCAVDGMCGTACPVGINTGLLVKHLRREDNGTVADSAWKVAAKGWSVTGRAASTGLTLGKRLPSGMVTGITDLGRKVAGTDRVPRWTPDLPKGGRRRKRRTTTVGSATAAPVAVYLPACVGAMFGPADGTKGVQWSLEQLCERAGVALVVPEKIDGLCCGTPWSSKGLPGGYDLMQRRVVDVVRAATRDGELPLISDASSCTEGFLGMVDKAGLDLTVVDAVQFVAEQVLPRLAALPEESKIDSLALHPTCSSTQLGLNPALTTVASAVAKEVAVPLNWGCCAFAGDRGLLHPELTESATRKQAAEVNELGAAAHASCNRTCELGMSRATGQTYHHVLELLEQVTR